MRRRTMRPKMRTVSGRIRLGTAGASPRLRRWALAVVLLGVALLPLPLARPGQRGARGGVPVGCRAGSVPSMIRWTRPLPGRGR